MPIDVSCPKCGSGLPVPEEFAGRTVRCGGCNELIPVPALIPPPLPGAAEPPPLPQARPVAKPVARAVPVKAEPLVEVPRPEPATPAVTLSKQSRVESEPERAKPQTKMALFVIAGMMLFGCCGFGVLGYAFVQLTKKVTEANRRDRSAVSTEAIRPAPIVTPDTPPRPATRPSRETPIPVPPPTRLTPPTRENPPTRPDPKTELPQAPSPQGMKGLKHYVSFNAEPIREDTTRTVLPVVGAVRLNDGPNHKASRFQVATDRDGDTPQFACDFSGFAPSLTFKKDAPFTLALWVRGGGQDVIPFAATQSSLDQAPRLFIRAEPRVLRVDFHCDNADAKKRFTRSVTKSMSDMIHSYHHVAFSRGADGTLAAFVNGTELTDAPAESLPAKQPGEFTFRYAGFGLRSERVPYTFDIDAFCVFDRALSTDELNALAGKGPK